MTTPKLLDGVRLFMEAGDQLPSPGFGDTATRQLRLKLLDEEFTEYIERGEDEDNLVEIVDGLLDIIVVAYGSILAYEGTYKPVVNLTEYPMRGDFGDLSLRLETRGLMGRLADDYFDAEGDSGEWRVMVTLYRLIRAAWNSLRLYIGTDAALECAAEVTRSNLDKIVDGKVIKNEAGKIQKPEGWVGPDIVGVLGRHGLLEPAAA